jgi:hypothetical protein
MTNIVTNGDGSTITSNADGSISVTIPSQHIEWGIYIEPLVWVIVIVAIAGLLAWVIARKKRSSN